MKDKNVKEPLISVVTVCKDAESTIKRTLSSIIHQDYDNFEYIVIDGQSTDQTRSIIEKNISGIDVFFSEKDTGIYNAMNKSISMASGEWIIFMNAGDIFSDHTILRKAVCLFNENSDVVYGDILIEEGEKLFLKSAPEVIKNIHRMPFCHQAAFTKTALLKKYSFDEKYDLSADFHFYKKLIQNKAVFQKIELSITIFDCSGISNTQRIRGLLENISIINELDNFISKIKLLPRLYFVVFWNKLREK